MATIKEINDDSKAKLDALLAFANQKTGASDVSLGDAVKTLADGYGQGGGDLPYKIVVVTPSEDTTELLIPLSDVKVADMNTSKIVMVAHPSVPDDGLMYFYQTSRTNAGGANTTMLLSSGGFDVWGINSTRVSTTMQTTGTLLKINIVGSTSGNVAKFQGGVPIVIFDFRD